MEGRSSKGKGQVGNKRVAKFSLKASMEADKKSDAGTSEVVQVVETLDNITLDNELSRRL